VHFQEENLHQVLGLGFVPQHRKRETKYVFAVAVKQHQKRVVISGRGLAAQRFIRERTQLVRRVRSFPEHHHAPLTRHFEKSTGMHRNKIGTRGEGCAA
jgi:hypothetical protein